MAKPGQNSVSLSTAGPRVVVVTGASAGVGRATARALARRGARLGLLARGRDGLEGIAGEVRALGGEALPLPTDVADDAQVRRSRDAVVEAFGPIDLWINDAMVSVFSPVRQMSAAEYRRVTEVTYLGVVHGTLAALEHMLARDRGVIVQVGSALCYRAIPLQSAYCAAKHAVKGFTESLRCELLHDGSGVRVAMVHLPAMNTPHFAWARSRLPNKPQPVPPIFQPEVAAQAIVWAADHPAVSELSVGWPTLRAIQGNKIAPGYADRYLARYGYSRQQTSEPARAHRPDNLSEPIEGDFGARGAFDAQARDSCAVYWVTSHKGFVPAVAGTLQALAALVAGPSPARQRSVEGHAPPRAGEGAAP